MKVAFKVQPRKLSQICLRMGREYDLAPDNTAREMVGLRLIETLNGHGYSLGEGEYLITGQLFSDLAAALKSNGK